MLRRTRQDGLLDLAHLLSDLEVVRGTALRRVRTSSHQIFFTRMRIGWLSPTTASTPWPSGSGCAEPAEPNCIDSVSSMILSLIHISEPTRLGMISYAVFCLKK